MRSDNLYHATRSDRWTFLISWEIVLRLRCDTVAGTKGSSDESNEEKSLSKPRFRPKQWYNPEIFMRFSRYTQNRRLLLCGERPKDAPNGLEILVEGTCATVSRGQRDRRATTDSHQANSFDVDFRIGRI